MLWRYGRGVVIRSWSKRLLAASGYLATGWNKPQLGILLGPRDTGGWETRRHDGRLMLFRGRSRRVSFRPKLPRCARPPVGGRGIEEISPSASRVPPRDSYLEARYTFQPPRIKWNIPSRLAHGLATTAIQQVLDRQCAIFLSKVAAMPRLALSPGVF